MKTSCYFALVSLVLLISCNSAFGQVKEDTTKLVPKVVVKMINGDEFTGVVIQQNEVTLVLKTENGDLNLLTNNINRLKKTRIKVVFRLLIHTIRVRFLVRPVSQLKRRRDTIKMYYSLPTLSM